MNASLALASGLDDAFAAAPLVVLALAGLAALASIAFAKDKAKAAFASCAGGLAAAIAASFAFSLPMMPRRIGGLLSMDGLSLFGTAIVLVSGLTVAITSWPILARREGERGEFYVLVLFASLGACVLTGSSSLATLFLGIELLSVSLYSLVAYERGRVAGAKAAFTYLILASAASAFILFGMALAYFQVGSLEFAGIEAVAAEGIGGRLLVVALAMMGVGFSFKLAVAPFHMWAPEVYEGASAPVAALVATVSKAAMAIPLIRALASNLRAPGIVDGAGAPVLAWAVAILSAASMIAGNLIALREERVKRMLAGSSIAQVGYLLVALVAGGEYGAGAALFYLAVYSLATLGAFACVAAISGPDREAGAREDYRGLARRRPLAAAVMTASLLSLAGMPLTAGFIGKFMLLSAGMRAGTIALAILLALNSAVSLFYYLRLVSLMYRREEGAGAADTAARVPGIIAGAAAGRGASVLAGAMLALVGLSLLILGAAPGRLLSFLSSALGR
jgi:NADH-quinone oxidoreductase subunit N